MVKFVGFIAADFGTANYGAFSRASTVPVIMHLYLHKQRHFTDVSHSKSTDNRGAQGTDRFDSSGCQAIAWLLLSQMLYVVGNDTPLKARRKPPWGAAYPKVAAGSD